ncbi:MAG: 2-phospho-L-lactate guanylyltransferase [Ilumatobacteraceae bacterium]
MTAVTIAVLLPVKAFHEAKARLRPALTDAERARLARWMAGRVVAAAAPHPVFVVCDDRAVAGWADSVGATVLWRPARGLNAAVGDGFATLSGDGYSSIVVSHSDLPLAADLGRFADAAAATLVPDHRDDGTNVLALPAALPFQFGYGAGSFHHHLAECRRLGVTARVVRDPLLALDVDTPDELADPRVQEVLPWQPTNPASRH